MYFLDYDAMRINGNFLGTLPGNYSPELSDNIRKSKGPKFSRNLGKTSGISEMYLLDSDLNPVNKLKIYGTLVPIIF